MSAKWRRSRKNRKWLTIFKAFSNDKDRRTCQYSEAREWKAKKRLYPSRRRMPRAYLEKRMKEPEPLLDVLERKGKIIVVSEFAGFSKDSLKISVDKNKLTLCAEALDRKYYKSLNLPKRVIANTLHTTYKNGVLEIQFKKAIEEETLDEVAD